jgi:hypothetical protein
LNRFGGVNLSLLAVKLFTGQPVHKPILTGPVEVSRSLQFFVHTEPIQRVVWKWSVLTRRDGKPDPRVMACLYDLRNRGIPQHLVYQVETDIGRFLGDRGIPRFFEKMVSYGDERLESWHDALCGLCSEPFRESVFVTDGLDPSQQEVQEQLPGIRIATPDALELLGTEERG